MTGESGGAPSGRGPDEDLLEEARSAMEAAYAPYSGYRVGAVLETPDGRRFSGCNVENASFPVTMCAERVALGAAVRAGAREFTRLALCVSGSRPASPCGMCRQALAEFGDDMEVLSVAMGGDPDEDEGKRVTWTLDELLPARFGGGDLTAGTET
ncbi:MAG TPA: cytidine deaminase [Gemmatimonadota bacterium]|nr:cytidine deaminase [Gemmatimonadota bacterium]